jgi:hypothetical protein
MRLDDFVHDAVMVGEIGDVALYPQRTRTDLLDRIIDRLPPSAGDDDLCAFGREGPGSGQSDSTVSTGNDGNFACKHTHNIPCSCFKKSMPTRVAIHSSEAATAPTGVPPVGQAPANATSRSCRRLIRFRCQRVLPLPGQNA